MDISDTVADVVISHFSKLPRGQPVTRSNGVNEWTVLAGIVSIHDGVVNKIPVCLATGVKATPDKILGRAEGRVLHDCHAEVLCLRAFNLFVMKEAKSGNGEYLEKKDGKYQLREDVEFAMYVSEAPCGDASLELIADEEEEQWDEITKLDGGVLRGRESFGTRGRVRTKPGRRDSPLTLSKSCSDKLAAKQITGLLNSLTSQVVDPSGLFLKYLILPEERSNTEAIQRCFHERLTMEPTYKIHVLSTTLHHEWERSETNTSPANLSVVLIPLHDLTEYITNGVKDGFYSKKTLARPRGESIISRRRLIEECKTLLDFSDYTSYVELKQRNVMYQELKTKARESLGGWCHTQTDDFTIV